MLPGEERGVWGQHKERTQGQEGLCRGRTASSENSFQGTPQLERPLWALGHSANSPCTRLGRRAEACTHTLPSGS